MLRTKCIWCGKTVRGGDDWAGRAGKCPKCGAEIFFPRIGPGPTEPNRTKPLPFIDPENYLNSSSESALAILAICGIAAWIWMQLIVILAYGLLPYRLGLRVAPLGNLPGLALNNGQQLGILWYIVCLTGFIWTLAVLVRAANHLVERHRPKNMAITAIVLMGVLAWIGVIRQAMPRLHPFPLKFGESPTRKALALLVVIFIAAGVVVWRDIKGRANPGGELEMQPEEARE